MQNNLIDSSIISVGNYEILLTLAPPFDADQMDRKIVQYLNGASIKTIGNDLQYKIDWKEKGQSINSISFLMPSDEDKLSDVFDTTPYGLIKKNRTGVGATTLELKSKRNSIIVVPTRALAYNKAKRSWNGNKYDVLYVGGSITGFQIPTIDEYIADESIPVKKFIVVADSLPRLLDKIGKNNYKDYFFMVDEVDSYQYDSWYRKSLENVIDYYFDFPYSQRCLVSATVGEFSNLRIEEEPIINVIFNQSNRRDIKLLHTNNVIVTTVTQINNIVEEHPNDKILIAYNSVRSGILQIIECLADPLKSKCAILCSEKSKEYADSYYSDITDENLPNQITFMTCTYFVGIDILERFHLISIAEVSKAYTLLSDDKLEQIAGRCRNDEGLLSETIIYQSREIKDRSVRFLPPAHELLKKQIMEDALSLLNFVDAIPKLKNTFFDLADNWLNRVNIDSIIDYSLKNYDSSHEVRLLRKNVQNEVQPAYLNIDNILIQCNMLNNLYLSKEALCQSLSDQGNYVDWRDIEEIQERIPLGVQRQLQERYRAIEEGDIQTIIKQLRNDEQENRITLAKRLKQNAYGQRAIFIERFIELQGYVPFDSLVTFLQTCKRQNKYDKFYNSVMFWALDDNHSFKIAFKEKFPLDTPLTGNMIKERLDGLLRSNLRFKEGVIGAISSKKVFGYLEIFCSKSAGRTRNRELGNTYEILNYDVYNLGAPLNKLDASVVVSEVFRFPSNILNNVLTL